jgi:nucleoside-diphosphate-sugar epimerase
MRVLIVGCGYIGLSLAAKLVQASHAVYGLRRSSKAEPEMRAAGVELLRGDLTRPESLVPLPRAYDWVVNCVSSSGGGAEDYRQVYLEGTRNLLAWLAPAPPRKFVYTSSTGVYGQTDGSIVDETSPTEPAAETAKILVETEQLLIAVTSQGTIPAVILRVAGIYGPGRGHSFKQFLRDEARIEGLGAAYQNMIHRDDVAGALVATLQSGQPGQIYNAVDDEPVTQRDFFQWLATRLRRPLPPGAPANDSAPRKRGRTNKRVSNQRLKIELGYHFRYPTFREGYAELIDLAAQGA